MPTLSYTDKVAPLQPDGTTAAFVVRSIEEVKMYDPTVTKEDGKKLKKKVPALKVTLSLIVGEGDEVSDPYPFVDFIYIMAGWMGKLDALRIATGEEIASREDFDTDTLIGGEGFLVLTEKDGKNFVGKYLSPEDGETEFEK
jgi:hypothetical protein